MKVKNRILEWAKENWFWVLVYGLIFAYFLARVCWLPTDPALGTWSHLKQFISIPLAILLVTVFVNMFSNPTPAPLSVGTTDVEKAEAQKECERRKSLQRRNWMIFAYSFMLFALLVPIYIFSAGWPDNKNKTLNQQNLNQDLSAPMAVFVGCTLDERLDEKNELRCLSEKKADTTTDANDNSDGKKKSVTKNNTNVQSHVPSTAESKTPDKSAWVLNLGGHVTNTSECSKTDGSNTVCKVRGGLLIPLYVIILALMGGSISLTRRLPEYQKRADPNYIPTEKDSKLTQHEFREELVFQIVQFVSAPLIAILAYYLVEPNSIKASVALAFTAGFASESILLMVRSVAEKVIPASASSTQKTGAISGIATLDGEKSENIEISLTSSPQIQAKTDKCGFYILNNLPVGEHGVKVSKAGYEDIEGSIKIERVNEIAKYHWTLKLKKAPVKDDNKVKT